MKSQDQIHIDWEQTGRFLADTLSEREHYCIETHLKACAGCREILAIRSRMLPISAAQDGAWRGIARALRCGWSRIRLYLTGQAGKARNTGMMACLTEAEQREGETDPRLPFLHDGAGRCD